MSNIKDTFNQEQYDNYLKTTNYTGALNYLTDLYNNTEDLDERDAIKPFISNLRQKIHRDESMTRYATSDNQKQQYYFLDAIKNGSSIEGNSYYDEYTKTLANIGSYDKRGNSIGNANQLEFKFKSEKTYNNFLSKLGITDKQLQESNVLVGSNNGARTVMINKSNPIYYNIIKSAYDVQNDIMNETSSMGYGPNADPLLMIFRQGIHDTRHGIEYSSYDNKGNRLKDYSSLWDGAFNGAMSKVNSLIADAESNYDRLSKLATQDLIVSSFRLPWKTAAHARAEELLNSTGDTEEYNRTIARLDAQLETALNGLILSQHNVYSTQDADDPNYHKLDLEQAHKYQQILRNALREKRATPAMAMYGDKFGYQIDIEPEDDEKGGWFSGETNSKIHRTIFIENPWPNEDMTRAFEQRTEFRAIKELILMDMYKYPYDFDDGSSLSMTNAFGGVYKHADGYEEQVDKDKAAAILNEQFIKEDGIRMYQAKYKDSQNKTKFSLGKFQDGIDKNVWAFAMQAAKELVPDTQSNAYLEKAYDLYQSILNGIQYKGDPAVKKVEQ